jgi:hypothetical protein
LVHGDVTGGPFQFWESITGSISGATGTIALVDSNRVLIGSVLGTFIDEEDITGNISLAVATLTAIPTVSMVNDAPANQDTPFAFASAPLGYGFMQSGDVEDLLNSIALVQEIEDARVDLNGGLHVSLADRLAADAAGSAIADRLGKEMRSIQGIDTSVPGGGADTINVSQSFSKVLRDLANLLPSENFEGFGSETRVGAITSGIIPAPPVTGTLTDDVRNVCAIVDLPTEARILDSSNTPIYGRLSLSEITLTGTVQFSIGLPSVTGVGTVFQTEINAGDIIQDGLGNFYEVAVAPPTQTTLTLTTNALGTTSPGSSIRRRVELAFMTRGGPDPDDDIPVTLPGGQSLRFWFSQWRALETAVYDRVTQLARNHEPPPVPVATTLTTGTAQVIAGIPEGKAGAVFEVQAQGLQIGPDHIFSIDFDGVADGGGGVANVTQRGPTGDQGPEFGGGLPGPSGPPGPQGVGITATNFFISSGVFMHNTGPYVPGFTYSHTGVFAGMTNDPAAGLRFIHGGLMQWDTWTGGVDANDHYDITLISKVDYRTARIFAKVPSGGGPINDVRLYLTGGGT